MINNKEIASKFNELNIKLRDAINDQPVSDDKTIKETIDKILELLSQNVIEGLSLKNLTDICNDLELEEAWAKGRGLNDKADALGILRGKALDAKIKREKGRLARETDIRKANKLESILNDNIEEKIAEFKKNAYISGNTGETIIDAHGTKLVINISSKDISAFEKNPSIKALRERCASDPEAAASFNNIAKQCLDSIQSDLNEIEKNNNIKAQLKKDLKEIKEGSFPLEAIKIPEPKKQDEVKDNYSKMVELFDGDVKEFIRITSEIDNYAYLMNLSPDKLDEKEKELANFRTKWGKDFIKIDNCYKRNQTDVKYLELENKIIGLRKAVEPTYSAMVDVKSIRKQTKDIIDAKLKAAKKSIKNFNSTLLASKADVLKLKYILGQATDNEIASFNSLNQANKIELDSQEKAAKKAISDKNANSRSTVFEEMYKRKLDIAQSNYDVLSKESDKFTANYNNLKEISDQLDSGKLTKYMGEVLKEKGSIPLGEKLYNNINNENVIGYDELIKKSIPGIDLDGMYVITDKSDIKLDESQQLGDQPQTLGEEQSAPEQSENNEQNQEQNHDPNQQTPDQQNQTQGKGKAKRRIPIKLGRLPKAARVLALATGLVVAASGVYFAFTSGVGQAIIATLANTSNLVGMGTVMGATLKAK